MEQKILTLDDSTIACVAKILQVAIISGTDIVDNLRQLQLYEDEDKLFVTDKYGGQFEQNVNRMIESVGRDGSS